MERLWMPCGLKRRGVGSTDEAYKAFAAAIVLQAVKDRELAGDDGRSARLFLLSPLCTEICDVLDIAPERVRDAKKRRA